MQLSEIEYVPTSYAKSAEPGYRMKECKAVTLPLFKEIIICDDAKPFSAKQSPISDEPPSYGIKVVTKGWSKAERKKSTYRGIRTRSVRLKILYSNNSHRVDSLTQYTRNSTDPQDIPYPTIYPIRLFTLSDYIPHPTIYPIRLYTLSDYNNISKFQCPENPESSLYIMSALNAPKIYPIRWVIQRNQG